MTDIHTHNKVNPTRALLSVSPREYASLSPDYDGKIAIGIHPWDSIDGDAERQIGVIERTVSTDPRVAAIGEIGFDPLRGADLSIQKILFEHQLAIAARHSLPVIVHCVRRYDLLLQSLKELKPAVPVIIHGFRGNAETAAMLLRAGLYLSLGEKFNAEAARVIPSDRLLVETDISTESIDEIIGRVARTRNVSPEILEDELRRNVDRIFKSHDRSQNLHSTY